MKSSMKMLFCYRFRKNISSSICVLIQEFRNPHAPFPPRPNCFFSHLNFVSAYFARRGRSDPSDVGGSMAARVTLTLIVVSFPS